MDCSNWYKWEIPFGLKGFNLPHHLSSWEIIQCLAAVFVACIQTHTVEKRKMSLEQEVAQIYSWGWPEKKNGNVVCLLRPLHVFQMLSRLFWSWEQSVSGTYTHGQWKRTTYKNDYIFFMAHLIFAIASYCTVAIPLVTDRSLKLNDHWWYEQNNGQNRKSHCQP